jgi:cytoskeleton protein RodZ
MERFCDELRWEREQRNVSIETICAETKVSSRHVEALESGAYGDLPGGVFRKGILRSYLKVLELDEAIWVERFEASLQATLQGTGKLGTTADDWAEFAENVQRTRVRTRPATGLRWLGVAGMFAVLVLVGWLVWTLVVHRRLEAVQLPHEAGSARLEVPALR